MSDLPLDAAGLPCGYPFRADIEITPREARRLHAQGRITLVDCRTLAEWEVARVEGAVLVPLEELESRHKEIPADEERPVCVLCHHGRRSLRAAIFLRQHGFDDAMSVAGGIDLWSQDADPFIPRYQREGARVWLRGGPDAQA